MENAVSDVGRQSCQRGLRLRRGDLTPKYSQLDGVCQFRLAERSQQERPGRLQQVLPRRSRMRIRRVQRGQNA